MMYPLLEDFFLLRGYWRIDLKYWRVGLNWAARRCYPYLVKSPKVSPYWAADGSTYESK